jgi:hypothetical protein
MAIPALVVLVSTFGRAGLSLNSFNLATSSLSGAVELMGVGNVASLAMLAWPVFRTEQG